MERAASMLFDRFAGYVEKHRPELLRKLQETHLFEFPYRAHEVVGPDTFTPEDLENFYLPFPAVAIEDRATCTFLFDTTVKQMGLTAAPRRFVDVLSLVAKDPLAFRERREEMKEFQSNLQGDDLHQLAFGTLFSMELPYGPTQSYRVLGQVDRLVLINGRGEIMADFSAAELEGAPGAQESYRGTLGNVITAIEELMLANRDPKLFVFEQTPLKAREPKNGRILRSPDRPRYVVLQPEVIRKIMGLQNPAEIGQGGRQPHERRRHWRSLQSERFTHKRGERILVEACWVGPSEAVVGKTHYRVRLDI
jgi:hypothetical protein